jgi:hypothetical protein
MNVASWAVWGFAATVALTIVQTAASGLGLTRMNIPYLLGTMITPHRDRAKFAGVLVHLVNGWLFALIYVAAFHQWRATAMNGAVIGLVHSLFVLCAAIPVLPAIHPRMASDERGPTPTRALEPPGFLASHYGWPTPIAVVIAHIVYGAILGAFYVT